MQTGSGLDIPLVLPDLWQQRAAQALGAGRDVIVQAPTGAGKTHIFELAVERGLRGQAVFTVPTRALANDKFLEWRRRGWRVGICTGDLAEDLDAPVVVATLETQRDRLLRRQAAPALLAVDEYQMMADVVRGVNYELALAVAPVETRLLLLSGSVANPGLVAEWLGRLGRPVELVVEEERPVPLEEIYLDALAERAPAGVRGFWPRLLGRALAAGLGPILVFAPRRKAAEDLARQLAGALPARDPLVLSPEQKRAAGDRLSKLLKTRVACHHSGMSYLQRAGLVEPLAKAGQLRVVVATMGLAAGINFSMRSVLVTDREYTDANIGRMVRADELLQMFGRAGRRGLDLRGFVLVAPDRPRMAEGRPLTLRRSRGFEWSAFLTAMGAAEVAGESSWEAAVRLAGRLFARQAPHLGVEASLADGERDCGLWVDAQRARLARSSRVEMLNSAGAWEPRSQERSVAVDRIRVWRKQAWEPLLARPAGLDGLGWGVPRPLTAADGGAPLFGREVMLATRPDPAADRWVLPAGLRKRWREARPTAGSGVVGDPLPRTWTRERLLAEVLPGLERLQPGARIHSVDTGEREIRVRFDFASAVRPARPDSHGYGLMGAPEREAPPLPCAHCPALERCRGELSVRASPALAWMRLGLIDREGRPTRRGELFGRFHAGEGLAVAAALEDLAYPVDELVLDLANLRAGRRFTEFAEKPDRLGIVCRETYGSVTYEGYLLHGLPPEYGDGTAEVLAAWGGLKGPARESLYAGQLRPGDVERARLEWLSLLRQIVHAPEHPWARWRTLQAQAAEHLERQGAHHPLAGLPPLTAAQQSSASGRLL